MKFLVYIDDQEESYSAFYRAMRMVSENDWIILLTKVTYNRGGQGNDAHEAMKYFGKLLDKRKIKSLVFMEMGSTREFLKEKVKQLKIDVIVMCPHNSRVKKLCDYVSDNIKASLMVVRECDPSDPQLVPPRGTYNQHARKTMITSGSMSSIPSSNTNAPAFIPKKQSNNNNANDMALPKKPVSSHHPLVKSQSEFVLSPRTKYLARNKTVENNDNLMYSYSPTSTPTSTTSTTFIPTAQQSPKSGHRQLTHTYDDSMPLATKRRPLNSSLDNTESMDRNLELIQNEIMDHHKSSSPSIIKTGRKVSSSSKPKGVQFGPSVDIVNG
ncbi:hypothetical protein DFA_04711 [Cavenderia fasciculata]|uniref:Uncharacterized protein n=1 Tax=Cavenderia fasciculata TaxID=261658 RepID=F4PQB8_CACFS|nr:uncharacterized protein DFA_04711 [Cavenderia fasciculata]EGG22581.1 hypothetical protein DFA_04711 [Cavenderia fasciculata]|eukprot:XP_004360432.1 hypothetical protein DFA_04711 [Cavenderia fasciculata]